MYVLILLYTCRCVPFMLKDMGIKGIRLMTNNPFKIKQLTEVLKLVIYF